MDPSKATPRPWRANDVPGETACAVWTEDGKSFVCVTQPQFSGAARRIDGNEADANARLIETAVNAHDRLADALRVLLFTPATRAWLELNDPKAAAQAQHAIDDIGRRA